MRNSVVSLIAFMLVINTCLCSTANGQKEFGFKMPAKTKQISIPFEQHNNLIIIPVTLNRYVTLKFILDTGVETAILTEKLYADVLDLNYLRQITIAGPGVIDSVEALVANEVTFSLPGGIIGQNMNMLVLKEDYLKLSENIGDNVHGIIGYDVFSRFVVDIDYDNNILTLTDPKRYKRNRKAVAIPLAIENTKPFLRATIKQESQKKDLDIMVDTGASHAALIDFTYLEGMNPPDQRIKTQLGRGIAGEIPGYVSRMDSVEIDQFNFEDMLISVPFDGAYNKVIKRGARIGTFGGELLTRFRVTFDYSNEMMYLRKGNDFKQEFEYDMSGLTLNSVGSRLDTLKVVNIDEGTPAYNAGIEVGDIVLKINGKNLESHSLSEMFQLLRSKDGKKIRLKILRDGEKIKKVFHLRRLI